MGLEHYGFALFVFVLVCFVLLVYKLLFSDIKRQQKLLDEKESKLLKLYQSLEDVMEEFYDAVEQARREAGKPPAAAPVSEAKVAEPAPVEVVPPKREAAIAEDFKLTMKNALEEQKLPEVPPTGSGGKREEILRLAREGYSTAQIARELNITQNEVALTVGMLQKKV